MISGIKRKSTAAESHLRFFQTVNLLINHFKREADKLKIFELTDLKKKSTLNDLLISTAAIHLYHNIGIRVSDSIDFDNMTIDSTKGLELREKEVLFDEIDIILKESLNLEMDMLIRLIGLEDKVISFLIEVRNPEINEFQEKKLLKDIDDQIEQNLIEIILKYPPFYFFDLIGDLIGQTDNIKSKLLQEGSLLKDLSIDIEKKLSIEEKEDKFIELSTLSRLINQIQEKFEFKSYKELQVQTMSVRMIKRKILEYNLNRFPISIPALKTYLKANNLKKQIIEKINFTLKEKMDYDSFENDILFFIKSELIKHLNTNPNDFIYFLQNLNETNLKETIYMLNKYGIYNILDVINFNIEIAQKINQNLVRYNIDKFIIINLSKENEDLISRAKKVICQLDIKFLTQIIKNLDNIDEFSLMELLSQDNDNLNELWNEIEKKLEIPIKELRQFVQKKQIIDKVFLKELNLNSYKQILNILSFDEVIEKIAREIFYFFFSKIVRQLSRIIELYHKISNEKALILLALKKMYGTTESERWIWIKLEELIIERIIKIQKELVVVFNALDNPFLVNGFIYARLTDSSLNDGINELRENFSPIYKEIKPIRLKEDIISPVSYCLAYDLIKRFETFEELRKEKVDSIKLLDEKKKEERSKEIRKQQEISTLNWIERRITSSLMRINSSGINPNQLYWQEKDTKIASENIKLHSELKGNAIEQFNDYFQFSINKIKEYAPELKLPDKEGIYNIIMDMIEKIVQKRTGNLPKSEEIENMLEGERIEISKQLGIRIGRFLDKALYSKFKNKRR